MKLITTFAVVCFHLLIWLVASKRSAKISTHGVFVAGLDKLQHHPGNALDKLTKRAGDVRGGAGPLDVKTTAKVATSIIGLFGAFGFLAPGKFIETQGCKSNPLDDLIIKRSSALVLSLVLLSWKLIFQEATLSKAVGVSTIPMILDNLQPLLNGDIPKLGFGVSQQVAALVFLLAVAYTTMTGSEHANLLVKMLAILQLVSGVLAYVVPEKFLELFGNTNTLTKSNLAMTREFAAVAFVNGLVSSCLLWGNNVSATTAVGYAWAMLAIYVVDGLFIKKSFPEVGVKSEPMVAWLIGATVVAATLAF